VVRGSRSVGEEEMIGVVQAAQDILYNYNLVLNNPELDFDARSNVKFALDCIKASDFYEIGRDITLYTNDAKHELVEGYETLDEVRIPVDARPPSENCFVYMQNSETGYLVRRYEAGEIEELEGTRDHPCVTVLRVANKNLPIVCGGYIVSNKEQDNKMFMSAKEIERGGQEFENYLANVVLSVAFTLCLINQPRFVVQGTTGTRQLRKQMFRGHGISMDAWNKISWNIKEPVKAKDDHTKGGWHMPLHYTRGHWRKAQDHWEDVVIRKDGKPYKWIDGFWSGHPAYGVKKSYHAPKLGKSYENV